MADKKTKKTETVDAPETGKKSDIIKAVNEIPKASNLVVDVDGVPTKFETVKRDDVTELLKKML